MAMLRSLVSIGLVLLLVLAGCARKVDPRPEDKDSGGKEDPALKKGKDGPGGKNPEKLPPPREEPA
jgi:hypothetical protein